MTKFSAIEPSLGYYYQIRYALYLILKTRDKEDHFVKLENLDDVEVGDLNKTDLYQTKFHNEKAANLTDSSLDIWKTIRVWSELALGGDIDLNNILLVLVTTSETPENSILHELTDRSKGKKTIDNVIEKLISITNTSNSNDSSLKKSFESFNSLSDVQKGKLVKSIHIRDNAFGFDDLKVEIQKELKLSCLPDHINNVYQDLEGWWFEQCIQHLHGNKICITFNETQQYIYYLIDRFKSDNLPIDNDIREATIDELDFDDRVFVNQLKSINIGNRTITQAKRDFYRTSEQRSKWLREHLLNPQEEINYEFRLKDDWDSKFAILQDEIDTVSEEIGNTKCKEFYENYYGRTHPPIYIRPRVTDPFIVTGSCHMLADKQRIVWHPKHLK
jgi:hypothetical protein